MCAVRRPKWPKRLEMSAKQNFEENQFYCCVYEGSKRWQHFMLFCVVAAVLVRVYKGLLGFMRVYKGLLGFIRVY